MSKYPFTQQHEEKDCGAACLFSAVDIAVVGINVVTGTAVMTALFVVWRQLKKQN